MANGSRSARDTDTNVPLRALAVLRKTLPADRAGDVAEEGVVAIEWVLLIHTVKQGNVVLKELGL
eukprot:14538276-Alexandrium_andersonii.AAC.1